MYPDPQLLVHLCGAQEWEAAQAAGEVAAESLREVGFIHLSAQHQAHLPACRLFAGRTDLVLLYVDPQRLSAPLRWDPGVPGDPEGMRFPHLYGPLPLRAVIEVRSYHPLADGSFAPLIHSRDVDGRQM